MLATTPSTRGIRLLFLAVAVTFVVLVGSLVADLLDRPAREVDRIALVDVPQGPSYHRAGDRAVVLVRDGDDVSAFSATAQPGNDQLVWCADHGIFATALSASGYRLDGRRLSGPGDDSLLRLGATVTDGAVEVDAVYPIDWPRARWSSSGASAFLDHADHVCTVAAR